MQSVTDLPFMRVIARRGGPDWFVTEFFRVHPASKPDRYILRSIRENTTGIPIFAQIIGSDADAMVKEAKILLRENICTKLGVEPVQMFRRLADQQGVQQP